MLVEARLVDPVAVVHQRIRSMDDDVTRGQDARKHIEVLASARQCARSEGGIEGADLHQNVAAYGHAHPCPHAGGRHGVQRSPLAPLPQRLEAAGEVCRRPHERGEVFREASSGFEPALGRVALLERQDDARRRSHVRGGREGVDHGRQPVGVNDGVVVGEDNDLASSRENAAVACPRQARTRRRDDTQPGVLDACELRTRQPRVGSVIDDDEGEALVVLGKNGSHGFLEHVRGPDGAHDDGGVNVGASALLPSSGGRGWNSGDARILLRVIGALDLHETGVASMIAHEDERTRSRRVAGDELADSGTAVNVPDGGRQVIVGELVLDAHCCSFTSAMKSLAGIVSVGLSLTGVTRCPSGDEAIGPSGVWASATLGLGADAWGALIGSPR